MCPRGFGLQRLPGQRNVGYGRSRSDNISVGYRPSGLVRGERGGMAPPGRGEPRGLEGGEAAEESLEALLYGVPEEVAGVAGFTDEDLNLC